MNEYIQKEQYLVFLYDTFEEIPKQLVIPTRLEYGRFLACLGNRFRVDSVLVLSNKIEYLEFLDDLKVEGDIIFGEQEQVPEDNIFQDEEAYNEDYCNDKDLYEKEEDIDEEKE